MTTATSIDSSPRSPAPTAPVRAVRERWHLALPGLLTAALAFRAGGYFPTETGIAAVVACFGVLLRVTVARQPFAGWSRAAYAAGLAGAGLASWTLLSGLWSDSGERATVEFDRTLLYLGVLVLMALPARRRGALDVLLRWVFAAFLAVCVAGLASRLAPDVFPISGRFVAERLSFPLTYWNAMGAATALATVLGLHLAAADDGPRWLRVGATAALPVTVTALYFTFSRGPMATCAVGIVAYVALSRSRRLLPAVAAAVLPVAGALAAAYAAEPLATARYFAAAGDGHRVAGAVVLCALLAAVLRLAMTPLERRLAAAGRPAYDGRAVAGVLAAGVVIALSVAVIAGAASHVRDDVRTFLRGDFVTETGDARDRLTSVQANGRPALWRASWDAFTAHPLHGTGAGTFRLTWEQARHTTWQVTDGHSLPLEVLGELGIIGAVLLAVLVLTPLGVAVRRLGGPERQAHAAFLAAAATLLLHAAMDWDWEMPALFVWYFAASGVVLARPQEEAAAAELGRLPRLAAGLACLVVAITPVRVVGSQTALDRATAAFAHGDCRTGVDAALSADEALPRASAFAILGYCDLRAGQDGLALRAMASARAHDPSNWEYAYGDALARAVAGRDPRAAADAAVRLNPLEPMARNLAREMRSPSAAARYRAAAHAPLPSD